MAELLDIPFYENEGNKCLQVSLLSAINYFKPNSKIDLTKLDELTGRRGDYATWTSQGVSALKNLGFKIKFFSKDDLEPYLNAEAYILNKYKNNPKTLDWIVKHADFNELQKSAEKILSDPEGFEKRVPDIEELKDYVYSKSVVIVLVDWNVIKEKEGYQGHYLVLTGFDNKNVYAHNSGPKDPQKNMKILIDVFEKARKAEGTDCDTIVVFNPTSSVF